MNSVLRLYSRPWVKKLSIFTFVIAFIIYLVLKDVDLIDPPKYLQYIKANVKDQQNIHFDFLKAINDIQGLNNKLDFEGTDTQSFRQNLRIIEATLPLSIQDFRKAILQKKHMLRLLQNL